MGVKGDIAAFCEEYDTRPLSGDSAQQVGEEEDPQIELLKENLTIEEALKRLQAEEAKLEKENRKLEARVKKQQNSMTE